MQIPIIVKAMEIDNHGILQFIDCIIDFKLWHVKTNGRFRATKGKKKNGSVFMTNPDESSTFLHSNSMTTIIGRGESSLNLLKKCVVHWVK